MNLRIKKPGFTLLEVLISASIFAIIGMLSTSIYVNLSQNKQKIVSRNLIYDDAQFILDQLSREIASNTIDYEEYYNQLVLGGPPGMNFGHYAAQFYYNLKTNKAYEDCVNLADPAKDGKKSCVNTGKNPANDFDPDGANAFYTSMTGDIAKIDNILCNTFLPSEAKSKYYACVQRLFLINGDGNTKTMIGREKLDWSETGGGISHVLSQLIMNSYQDTSVSPPITIPHIFTCAIAGNCTKSMTINSIINFTGANSATVTYPSNSSGDEDFEASSNEPVATTDSNQKPIARAYAKDFIPFTPSRVDIQNIKFFLSPVEDPHKAFAEGNNNGLQTDIHQPSITIVLTVQPISNVRYKTSYPSVTVQTTVTPGLFAEVQSFPPQMTKIP